MKKAVRTMFDRDPCHFYYDLRNIILALICKQIFNHYYLIGYQKSRTGTLCQPQSMEIQTEQECIIACAKLRYPYLGSWNGPGDFPKCVFTERLNRVCHFNTSFQPNRFNVNQNYAAICKCRGPTCVV